MDFERARIEDVETRVKALLKEQKKNKKSSMLL